MLLYLLDDAPHLETEFLESNDGHATLDTKQTQKQMLRIDALHIQVQRYLTGGHHRSLRIFGESIEHG